MTSATTRPASSTGRQVQGGGLILFASVLLLIIGCFNLIYGIAAIANSHVFAANAHYVFGSLRTWGWVTLVIGVLQLLAAAGVVAGSQLARWFAVAVLGLSAIDQMFFLPAYPLWSLVIIAVNVVALYRLCVYGSRANLAARRISARAGRSCDMEASMLHRTAPAERDRNSGPRRHSPAPPQTTQAGAQADRQPGFGWTLVLRRQPARIVDGEPQGGYTDAFELICCDCGDDPDLDYHHVSPGLQQIRGPYPVAVGIAAYEQHARRHRRQAPQARGIVSGR